MLRHAMPVVVVAGVLCAAAANAPSLTAQSAAVALVGATLIDGNGGPPVRDAVVVIDGSRIAAVGPRASVTVPAGATVVDAAGKFVVPGFVDTNVHLSLYGGAGDRYESLVRYESRQDDIVLEAGQIDLAHGVTTVRDSYGMLLPLVRTRDRITAGRAIGPRILAAGNILGWNGPYSVSFSLTPSKGLTLFQEQMNDAVAQGGGEDLMGMMPAQLRVAIDKYLGKGPDFLKYGGTSHFSDPTYIGFSPDAQKVIVDEAHKRGKFVDVHSTNVEGLKLSIEAGIDVIQHPELIDDQDMPDELVTMIHDRHLVCSMLVSTITGEAWQTHVKAREAFEKKRAEEIKKGAMPETPRTTYEQRQLDADLGTGLEIRRRNAEKLVKAGCTVTPGTDSYWAAAAELSRAPKPKNQDHGIGTIFAIEGLVELGMTPSQAIVAGTKNGAIASKGESVFGTLETGKEADLVVLDADPLADIHNIEKVNAVFKGGRRIDRRAMPQVRVLSRPDGSR